MLMRMIYDDRLAQAAYLIGCQRTGEAIVIDPERDVDRYINIAKKEGVRITGVAETHIHADFLSGARELAERVGARVYVSGEGGPDWQYQWLDKKPGGGSYEHTLLRHGDVFRVGNIEFKTLHTPGHTPEHVSFLVTDRGGGATEPMGVVTGDFMFVGDVGRPDLLETAAGQAGAKEPAARRLFESIGTFLKLPEWLQVWPAHGAGSACGKALGAVPQTTVGYEKRFNPAIAAARSESAFVDFILEGQPEPPLYFARMKRENRMGPRVLGALPKPRMMSADELASVDTRETALLDTRTWKEFMGGHVAGALFIPLDGTFAAVAGSYIEPVPRIALIVEEGRVEEAVRELVRIGLDTVEAYATPTTMAALAARGGATIVTSGEIDVAALKGRMAKGRQGVLDVRRATEFSEGHIPGAQHINYTDLPKHLGEVKKGEEVVVNCRSGARSARAVAYLEREGFRVTNLGGGFLAWEKAGEKVEKM